MPDVPDIGHYSPVPLYVQLANLLRDRIATGAIEAGRPLPSQRTLIEEYGLARGRLHAVQAPLRRGPGRDGARQRYIRKAEAVISDETIGLVRMARAWIELTGEQACRGPARLPMVWLSRAGYVCGRGSGCWRACVTGVSCSLIAPAPGSLGRYERLFVAVEGAGVKKRCTRPGPVRHSWARSCA